MAKYALGGVFLIMIIGIVLRYGNSSSLLANDLNTLVGTLTLQNAIPYHGPGQ